MATIVYILFSNSFLLCRKWRGLIYISFIFPRGRINIMPALIQDICCGTDQHHNFNPRNILSIIESSCIDMFNLINTYFIPFILIHWYFAITVAKLFYTRRIESVNFTLITQILPKL